MKLRQSQHGVVLLLIVLTMLAIGGVVLLAGLGGTTQSSQNSQGVAKFATLSDLKQAIFGFVLATPIGVTYLRPGNLPAPDSLAGGSYDGQSDTTCLSNASVANGLPAAANNTAVQRCLGRWPWQVIAIDLSAAARDASGNLQANDPNGAIPWLAVSANLALLDTCLVKLNSDILNMGYSGTFACPNSTNLPHPWLSVFGSNGELLTDRAAVVLIQPGIPLQQEGGYQQSRASAGAPGHPKDYLDRVSLPLGCSSSCTLYDNASLNNRFIQMSPGVRYPANAADTSKSGVVPFNDTVVFITIDELMPYIEKRVLAEMKASLTAFKITTGSTKFPWAAQYATAINDSAFNSNPGTTVGMFPFFPVSPSATPTGYTTKFDWLIAALQNSSRVCVRVRTTPSVRWVNIAENSIGESSVLMGSVTTATAKWRGASNVDLTGTSATTSFLKTFIWFSSAINCNNNSSPLGSSPSYTVTRTVGFATSSPRCSTPVSTYTVGDSTSTHRINWTCPRLTSPVAEFPITINDSLNSEVAAFASYNVYPGNTARVTISNLRYQPLMSGWFYDNEWHKQAFYAVGNASAPVPTTNCASINKLIVGAKTDVDVLVSLSGKSLVNATRPSMPVADYLESINSAAVTSCVFEAATKPVSTIYNDQILVVAP